MPRRVLALWKRVTKEGTEYFSAELDLGVLGKAHIAIFPNENKADEKHPDYYGKIYEHSAKDPYPETEIPA
ncbi:hypothetical protein ACFL4G_02675 [Thermodesulfobacteriota bacterium]